MSLLSERVQQIKISPTLAMTRRANELKAAGKDIISLSVGEPDFDTPDFIKEAAIKAIRDGFTKYTAVDGTPSLKKAIVNKFARENDLSYQPKQILVSCGAKHSLYNFFAAILNKGDEVIIPAPYWVSYPDMVLLNEGVPVEIATTVSQHFKITAAQLQAAITPKTRVLVLNSPSNPSGMVYSREELKSLAEVLLKHPQILILTDDIYEHILWTHEPFVNIVNVCPELYDRTIVVNGVSKSYAMTGWRIGYTAAAENIISAMTNIQSQSTSNPTSISQVAAEAALNGDQGFIREMNTIFHERHNYVYSQLQSIPTIACQASQGSFYIFPNIEKAMQKLNVKTDVEFCERLLEAGVAVIPGSAFGTPNCMRISFATSMENLQKAMQRLKNLLA